MLQRGWLRGWQESHQSKKDNTGMRIPRGRGEWPEKPVRWNAKTMAFRPLWGERRPVGKGWHICKSFHTKRTQPCFGPAGPAHRPVGTRLSALCRALCCSRQRPSSLDWKSWRSPIRSLFSFLVHNLGCSLVWWKGCWPGASEDTVSTRAGTLTGCVSIKEGPHFWEPWFPCSIRGTAAALPPQG